MGSVHVCLVWALLKLHEGQDHKLQRHGKCQLFGILAGNCAGSGCVDGRLHMTSPWFYLQCGMAATKTVSSQKRWV